ncbi:hypothetical protein B0H13DRAFT_1895776 [Mycena leptocephala]|nr:hypothetical protein B0H13DRAFT_1895776 [Mycena leptocephala]
MGSVLSTHSARAIIRAATVVISKGTSTLCEAGTLEQIELPKSMKAEGKKGWKPNRDPTSKRFVPVRFSVGGRIALEIWMYKILELELELQVQLENETKKQNRNERPNVLARRRGTNSISTARKVRRSGDKDQGEAWSQAGFSSTSRPGEWNTMQRKPDQGQERDLEEARYREWWDGRPGGSAKRMQERQSARERLKRTIDTVGGDGKRRTAREERDQERDASACARAWHEHRHNLKQSDKCGVERLGPRGWGVGIGRRVVADRQGQKGEKHATASLGRSACNWEAITREGIESVMWRQQDQGE